MGSGVSKKFILLALGLALASLGGSACIGGSGVGGGPPGSPPPLAPPNAAAPEVLGSVTEAPGIETVCLFNVKLRFAGETAEQANEDGNLPYVIQATPGEAGFDKAVLEKMVPGSPPTRLPCSECKERLLRVVDYGVYAGETIRPRLVNEEVPIDSQYGVSTFFGNHNTFSDRGGIQTFWDPKKIQDFSYDEAAQGYPMRNWLFQNKGMYLFLLAPKGTEKVESPKEISYTEWRSMLTATEETRDGSCLRFAWLRELRTLYPTAVLPTPVAPANGIVSPADDEPESAPFLQIDSWRVRNLPLNFNP